MSRGVQWLLMGLMGLMGSCLTPVAVAQATSASALLPPAGAVILEIRGLIGQRNDGDAARLDASALRALPQKQITTHMPWYDSRQTFSGPTLQSVLDLVQARGERLKLVALNDYSVEIPLADVTRYQPLLAHQINGKPLSVRDKGPLFLVYPFDSHPEIRNDVYYGRSIWQIAAIVVR